MQLFGHLTLKIEVKEVTHTDRIYYFVKVIQKTLWLIYNEEGVLVFHINLPECELAVFLHWPCCTSYQVANPYGPTGIGCQAEFDTKLKQR